MMVQIFRVSYTVFKSAAEYSTVYYHVNPKDDGYVVGTGNREIIYSSKVRGSDISDFAINLEPTAVLVEEEEDVLALPTINQSGVLQSQFDIGTDEIYIGKARQGVTTNVTGWTITRFTLISGVVVDKKITMQDEAIWDNRLIEIYY